MKVETLNYEGVTEQWKADLLVRRAKRFGFKGQDLEDVQQDFITEVAQFQYDPAKSNGATEETALTAMIDNKLKHLLRIRSRYNKRVDQFQKIALQTYEPGKLNLSDIDVRMAIEKLSPEEQAVCKALSEGYTKREIKKRLHLGEVKLSRILRQVRDRFDELGFNAGRR